MESFKSNTARTKTYIICAVLLCSGVIAFWTLSERSLNDHECFVSVTAREMLESGDWIMPTYNGEPRLQKTPLSYWLVAGLAKVTGKVDEFTTRLPSAVFGILSVAAIIYFVNQWLSFRIAILSAAVWATSLGYILHSHNARPEMVLTFFIILCFLTFYSAVSAKSRMAFCQKAYTNKFAGNFLFYHLVVLTIGFIALPIVIGQLLPEVLRAAIISSAAGLIGILVVAVLFRAGKASVACGALFVMIVVLVMIGHTGFVNPSNYNLPSRKFTQAVVQKVPTSDKLIAYKSASERFVHYFGKRVPKIESKSEVYDLYKKGWWVVAFGQYLDELLEDNSFEIIYRQENAERHSQEVVSGALLHKSDSDSKDKI